jgi:hypothetical protein
VASIYDKLYDVTETHKADGTCIIEHNVYKTDEKKPRPWTWDSIEKFGKWMDNRLDCRRKHLLSVLTPHVYFVTQKKGTERAFTGDYWWYNDVGMYNCAICSQRVFSYEHKYKNKSGFPTFWNSLKDSIRYEEDHLVLPEVTNALQDPTLQCKTPIKRVCCSNVSYPFV